MAENRWTVSGSQRPDDDPMEGDELGLGGPLDPPLSEADEELLRRELEDLEAYLEEHADEAGDRPLDVDVEVRRRKAEVLRGVLDEDADGSDAVGPAR